MDDAQLTTLYEQYGYLVHRRCLAILRAREEAEDVMQEVFLRVRKSREPDASIPRVAWLYRIASHCWAEAGALATTLQVPSAIGTATVCVAAENDPLPSLQSRVRSRNEQHVEVQLLP